MSALTGADFTAQLWRPAFPRRVPVTPASPPAGTADDAGLKGCKLHTRRPVWGAQEGCCHAGHISGLEHSLGDGGGGGGGGGGGSGGGGGGDDDDESTV